MPGATRPAPDRGPDRVRPAVPPRGIRPASPAGPAPLFHGFLGATADLGNLPDQRLEGCLVFQFGEHSRGGRQNGVAPFRRLVQQRLGQYARQLDLMAGLIELQNESQTLLRVLRVVAPAEHGEQGRGQFGVQFPRRRLGIPPRLHFPRDPVVQLVFIHGPESLVHGAIVGLAPIERGAPAGQDAELLRTQVVGIPDGLEQLGGVGQAAPFGQQVSENDPPCARRIVRGDPLPQPRFEVLGTVHRQHRLHQPQLALRILGVGIDLLLQARDDAIGQVARRRVPGCQDWQRNNWGTVPIFVRRKWDCPLRTAREHGNGSAGR